MIAYHAVTVVEIKNCVRGRGQVGDLDPCVELPGPTIETFDLVTQSCRTVGRGEDDVITIILCVRSEIGIGSEADQDWEVGEITWNLRGVDRDRFAVIPIAIPP